MEKLGTNKLAELMIVQQNLIKKCGGRLSDLSDQERQELKAVEAEIRATENPTKEGGASDFANL